VALNLLLIPGFSFLGSAAVAVVTEVVGFGLMYVALAKSLPGIGFATLARAPLVAGGLAYLAALVGLGAVGRAELELARSLLPGAGASRRA
jgi:hypothetical protein